MSCSLEMSVENGIKQEKGQAAVVIDSGLALIDFLSSRLTAKNDLVGLLQANSVEPEPEIPGLVIKAYLLLARKLKIDAFEVLTKKRAPSSADIKIVVENAEDNCSQL